MTVILCWHFCSHASTSWQSQLSLHLCTRASLYYLHWSALYNSVSTNIYVCHAFSVIYLRFHTCAALSKFEARWHCTMHITKDTQVACIDKWVNSKFEDAHPLALCSGPKLAIWNKNQPPRPKKNPGHGEKCKMVILLLFGSRRSLGEKETDSYNGSCPSVFNFYDICTPHTSARHP